MRLESRAESEAVAEAEETLRRVAQLPPPDGLTERVHRRLWDARAVPERRGFWRLWLPAHRVQFAGAALLVATVVVSTLSVRHSRPAAPVVAPAQQPATPFGSAGTERRPTSLTPILVPATKAAASSTNKQTSSSTSNSKKKKPSAGHVAKRATTADPAPADPAQSAAKGTTP